MGDGSFTVFSFLLASGAARSGSVSMHHRKGVAFNEVCNGIIKAYKNAPGD
jgi:hypothetical protein